jgi:signal transduction histidine kinase
MMIIYFFNGLLFAGLGLAAYLQMRQAGDYALKKQLPWLAAFGFVAGGAGWVDMFLASGSTADIEKILNAIRLGLHLLSGLLLLRFGWGMLNGLEPLPAWTIFIPGILIVPIAYVITYAATTFVTPSPIEIPMEIWTRYLLYLPGSLLAGIGFLRQWYTQKRKGMRDVANLMLGAGLAFVFEAIVVGLIVPAAPYGPASYYNYDRVIHNAFLGEKSGVTQPLIAWLDDQAVLDATGMPIEFWRLLSAAVVVFFVAKALDVFDAIRKRQMRALEEERDRAHQEAIEVQVHARQSTEAWTNSLVSTSRRIAELENVDEILRFIIENLCKLLEADFAGLAIIDQGSESPALKGYATRERSELITNQFVATDNPLLIRAMRTMSSHRTGGQESEGELNGLTFFSGREAGAAAIVPLKMENTAIGALWVARFERRDFSETDLIYLDSMADQVVISIQHGLMTSQLQSLSITEERARIARDMHDGVAQVLGYLNLQVQTLDSLLKQGKSDQLRDELAQMREAVQTAHADVRENILSLRTTLSDEKGLASAIKEYLDEFGIQTGVETKLEFQVEGELNLSSVAEVQLVCILQEALTNVRKHAKAAGVEVVIFRTADREGERIVMQVRDDGVGFTSKGSRRSFGMQTMRERAESVGGKLAIQSEAGQGTRIECRLPCLSAEQQRKPSLVIP